MRASFVDLREDVAYLAAEPIHDVTKIHLLVHTEEDGRGSRAAHGDCPVAWVHDRDERNAVGQILCNLLLNVGRPVVR